MRTITTHHDGHGLNDDISIESDEQDRSGASHAYRAILPSRDEIAFMRFQQGPRFVDGSEPGITNEVLYAILIDRLEGFQAGPFACPENKQQLDHVRSAQAAARARADARAQQGVLGKNEPHKSAS